MRKTDANFTVPGHILDQLQTCLLCKCKQFLHWHMINKAPVYLALSKRILRKPKRRSKNFYNSRYQYFGKPFLTSD